MQRVFLTLQYRYIPNVLKYKDNMAFAKSAFFSTATAAFNWQVLYGTFLVPRGLGQHLSYPRTELAGQILLLPRSRGQILKPLITR